jgi:hypothetical protein
VTDYFADTILMDKNNGNKRPLSPGAFDLSDREKRSGTDRRSNKKARLKYLLFKGRRERVRREEDRHKLHFFDRYNPKLFAAIIAILMLSIFDAILTLILIENGSSELNPIMAYLLEHGPLPFVIVKYCMTCCGVVILLIFSNVFLTKVNIYTYSLFPCIIIAFSAVIIWELFLIFTIL